jgi:hypothetical protein
MNTNRTLLGYRVKVTYPHVPDTVWYINAQGEDQQLKPKPVDLAIAHESISDWLRRGRSDTHYYSALPVPVMVKVYNVRRAKSTPADLEKAAVVAVELLAYADECDPDDLSDLCEGICTVGLTTEAIREHPMVKAALDKFFTGTVMGTLQFLEGAGAAHPGTQD